MSTPVSTSAGAYRAQSSANNQLGDLLICTTIALTLVGYPLVSAMPELTGLPTRDFSVPYRGIFLIVALLTVGISFRERLNSWPRVFAFLFVSFWMMYMVRLINDTLLHADTLGFEPSDYWLFTVGVTLVPSIAFARVTSVEVLERAARWSAWLLIVAAASNLWVGWDIIPDSTDLFRFGTESVNPIAVGTVGSRLFMLTLLMLLRPVLFPGAPRLVRRRYVFATILVGLPLGAAALFFSGSRGPIVATLACTAIALYLVFKRAENRIVIPVALVGLVVMVIAIVLPFVVNMGGSVLERFYLTTRLEDMSDFDRFTLWESGFSEFMDSPVFGSGIEETHYHFYPHNIPLEAFMATGILGGAVFMAMSAISFKSAFRLLKHSTGALWLPILYLNNWIIALFSGSIWGAASLVHLMVATIVLERAMSKKTGGPR